MVDIVTRAGKGSPLTNAEVDANFTNLAEVATVGGEPIGHEDITESSISFTTASRTFSISPVGASFTVWCKGNKHVFTSAQTVVIPNTTGLHYIYFSDAGVLSTKPTYFTWDSDAPTAYVYWNATTGAAVYFGDERHGVVLDWQTHEYLHRTRGAAIANGFAASGYTTSGSGNLDTDAQLACRLTLCQLLLQLLIHGSKTWLSPPRSQSCICKAPLGFWTLPLTSPLSKALRARNTTCFLAVCGLRRMSRTISTALHGFWRLTT
jgi:hypothetical protein